jgi:hypothetical protein
MAEKNPTLDYHTDAGDVLAGSASRAFRAVGGVSATGMAVVATALWAFCREPLATKVVVTLVLFGFAVVTTSTVSIAARFTIARVQNGFLYFSFCGVRTRAVPLDSTTTFQVRQIGRLRVLVITSGQKSYVPNGTLDRRALMELLRQNGVVESP